MSDKYGAMHHAGNTGRTKTLSHETGKAHSPSNNSILITVDKSVVPQPHGQPLLLLLLMGLK